MSRSTCRRSAIHARAVRRVAARRSADGQPRAFSDLRSSHWSRARWFRRRADGCASHRWRPQPTDTPPRTPARAASGCALWLALAALAAPATGFFALHEFHPEAFSAPVLLLLFHARIAESRGRSGPLCCSAARRTWRCRRLLTARSVGARGPPARHPADPTWYGIPAAAAVAGRAALRPRPEPDLEPQHITPLFTPILAGAARRSWRGSSQIRRTPRQPFGKRSRRGILSGESCFPSSFPSLRPRWFLAAAPILAQHLLSWREFGTIFITARRCRDFWMATAEAIASRESWHKAAAPLVFAGCVAGQFIVGFSSSRINRLDRGAPRGLRHGSTSCFGKFHPMPAWSPVFPISRTGR